MLLITTIDMVTKLTDADCKLLAGYTAKDKIIVLSKAGAMMPVAMFQILSSLKCQLEIKEINISDMFQLGYTFGRLTASVKNTEKIILLTSKEFDVDDKNIIKTDSLAKTKAIKASGSKTAVKDKNSLPDKNTDGAKKSEVEKKADTEKKTEAVKKSEVEKKVNTEKKTEAVKKSEVEKKANADKKTDSTKKADMAKKNDGAKKTVGDKKSTEKNGTTPVLWSILGKYTKMKSYKEFVNKNEEALINAILNASDAEITFKFLLQLNFGTEGVGIWEILYKDFEDIQAKVKAAAK